MQKKLDTQSKLTIEDARELAFKAFEMAVASYKNSIDYPEREKDFMEKLFFMAGVSDAENIVEEIRDKLWEKE